jgi:hypothetical protein
MPFTSCLSICWHVNTIQSATIVTVVPATDCSTWNPGPTFQAMQLMHTKSHHQQVITANRFLYCAVRHMYNGLEQWTHSAQQVLAPRDPLTHLPHFEMTGNVQPKLQPLQVASSSSCRLVGEGIASSFRMPEAPACRIFPHIPLHTYEHCMQLCLGHTSVHNPISRRARQKGPSGHA